MATQRPSGRAPDALRALTIERRYTKHAEGSVLIGMGDTLVLCTASVEERIPPWLRGKGEGWVTAEYGMLPRATSERTQREAARGGQGGRTMEIQRLIGRSLRACVDRVAEVVGVGGVGPHGEGVATVVANPGGDLLELGEPPRSQDQARPFPCEQMRRVLADAGGRAGDQDRLAGQKISHVSCAPSGVGG